MSDSELNLINLASTVVVAAFAVLQVYLAWHDGRKRIATAAHVVMTEWQRLYFFNVWLKDEDLVTLARHARLLPSRVLPSDSALLATSLAELGPAASVYGGSAIAFAHQTASDIEFLTYLTSLQGRPTAITDAALRDVEAKIEKSFGEVVELIEDAKNSAPRWVLTKPVKLGVPTSALGRSLKRSQLERDGMCRWGLFPVYLRLPPWR